MLFYFTCDIPPTTNQSYAPGLYKNNKNESGYGASIRKTPEAKSYQTYVCYTAREAAHLTGFIAPKKKILGLQLDIYPDKRMDNDGGTKIIQDGIAEGLMMNDFWIAATMARRHQRDYENPRVEVTVYIIGKAMPINFMQLPDY